MHKTPHSYSAGALPKVTKKGPAFRKDGLHQSANWVIAHKGPDSSPASTRTTWQVPANPPEAPTEAMIKGWPRWAIPGFLEQMPPRLEACRQRLLAAEIELRRAEKAGGLEVGNASAPQEEAESKAVAQDLPTLKAPEEAHDEFADMPQEAEWILDQVSELETQFAQLEAKMQELEVSHTAARKLKNQYAEDAGTCFATMMELSSRVTSLTEQLQVSQGTAGALREKLTQAIGNTQHLQKQVAEGHSVAERLSQQLNFARSLAERYKGEWEAVTEQHESLRAQHESLENAKFVLEKEKDTHKGQLAKADATHSELRGDLERAEQRLEQLEAESRTKDAALRELQAAFSAEKEGATKQPAQADPTLAPLPATTPEDPLQARAEAQAVARLVVKDWLRTALPAPEPAPVESAGGEASSAELAKLRAQLEELQAEKAAAVPAADEATSAELAKLRAQLEELQAEKAAAVPAANEEASAELAKLRAQLEELQAEKPAAVPAADEASSAELANLRAQLEELRAEKDAAAASAADAAEALASELHRLEGSNRELLKVQGTLRSRLKQEEAQGADVRDELEQVQGQLEELSTARDEAAAALQKLQDETKEKDVSLQQLSDASQEKDATIQELQATLDLQKERARAQADASDDDLRSELARVEEQLDQLTKTNREKDAALTQLQETSEAEKIEAKAQADAAEEQLRVELKRVEELLEQRTGEAKEKDEAVQQLTEAVQSEQAKAEQEKTQATACQEELRGQLSRVGDELEQVSSKSREKDVQIQQLEAALESEKAGAQNLAEADAGREQLLGELSRSQAALEQASKENQDKALELQRLQAALDAEKEAAASAKPSPDMAPPPVEACASRSDVEAVARLVVKDWLRTGSAAAVPPTPTPAPEPRAQEPEASAGPTPRMQQEQWLSEWPCGPKELQMALVPASVLCSGVDSSLAQGQLAPTRLWLDAGTDELYMQPLLPSGPPSKFKPSSVTSVTCTQPSAYDDDASLDVEIKGGGAVRNLKFFSDGEGIEMLLAALTRDTRVMPGQLMDMEF